MKQTPILFSTPMVQAILEGRKTQTRRTTGLEEVNISPSDWECFGTTTIKQIKNGKVTEHFGVWFEDVNSPHRGTDAKCPYGQPGDVLWVREPHFMFGHWEKDNTRQRKSGRQAWKFMTDSDEVRYAENPPTEFRKGRHKEDPQTPAWHARLARFMPKAAARIWLRVADVRVERLQSISEADAKAEGVELTSSGPACFCSSKLPHSGAGAICSDGFFSSSKEWFEGLWQSINGIESWEANPWVWVVTFEVISTTGKPSNI